MKRYYSIVLALFAAVLLALPARAYGDAAFAALPFNGADTGVTTTITDTQGAAHTYDGALDAAALADYPVEAARIASYTLTFEGAELLSVELHDFEESAGGLRLLGAAEPTAMNGYVSVAFTFTKDAEDYEAFLTGLKTEQAGEVQDALLDSLLGQLTGASGYTEIGKLVDELDFIDYIDTEKMSKKEGSADGELCWAATTSNILTYTGWAYQAGLTFDDGISVEDQLFGRFVDNFTNNAGNVHYGLEWFFNGRYYPDTLQRYELDEKGDETETETEDWQNWSHLKDRDGEPDGNYFPKYPLKFYSEDASIVTRTKNNPLASAPENIVEAARLLREGYGVGISLGWYKIPEGKTQWARTGGHAITLWGYVRRAGADDTAFDRSSYVALITTDSDTDPVLDLKLGSYRYDAPNKLCLMPLTPWDVTIAEGEVTSWQCTVSGKELTDSDDHGVVEEFICLKPYDQCELYEDNGAFYNDASPDLVLQKLYLSDCAEDIPFEEGIRAVFAAGSEMSVSVWQLWNNSDAPYNAESVSFSVELREGEGEFVPIAGAGTFGCTHYETDPETGERYEAVGLTAGLQIAHAAEERVSLGTLGAGEYTVRVTLAGNETDALPKEAYYTNNRLKMSFIVTESGYDLSEASMYVSGAVENQEYDEEGYVVAGDVPLSFAGLDGIEARSYYVTVAYGSYVYDEAADDTYEYDENGNPVEAWMSAVDVSELDGIDSGYTASIQAAPIVRFRLMIRPENEEMPWPSLTLKVPMAQINTILLDDETGYYDYFEAYYYYDFYAGGVYLWCAANRDGDYYINGHLMAGGYDRDGRMMFFGSDDAENFVPFGADVVTMKLFWVDDDYVPRTAAINIAQELTKH